MAFATSNIKLRSGGSTHMITGNWTGSKGDAAGTYTVTGKVHNAVFTSNSSSGPSQQVPCYWSQNSSTGVTTITVPNVETVTTGDFVIEFNR